MRLLHKIEIFVDAAVPILVLVLMPILFIDLIYSGPFGEYTFIVRWLDNVVLGFLIVDLGFKFRRMRHAPSKFLKKYWLEIISAIPFFLMFRAFEAVRLLRISDGFSNAVSLLESVEETGEDFLRAEATAERAAATAEKAALNAERSVVRSTRILRFVARSPRLLAAFEFWHQNRLSIFKRNWKKGKR